MLIFYSTHYPKPEFEDQMLDSMHQFGNLMATQPGLIFVAPWPFKDLEKGTLMGVTIWESHEAFDAAMAAIRDLPRTRPSHDWERQPTEAFILDSAR